MWSIAQPFLLITSGASVLSFARPEACSVSRSKGHLCVGGAEAHSSLTHNKIMEVGVPWERLYTLK